MAASRVAAARELGFSRQGPTRAVGVGLRRLTFSRPHRAPNPLYQGSICHWVTVRRASSNCVSPPSSCRPTGFPQPLTPALSRSTRFLHFDLIIVILCDAQPDVSISMLGNIPRGFEF